MKEEPTESYSHILKYTGIFGGVQGLNILVSLVRNKLVALILGPSGMGLASLFSTTVSFISQATNFGISFSAVKHVSEFFDAGDEERIAHFVKVVRSWSLLTALLGMLVCILAGPLLSDYTFSWGNHTLHFILLSPAVGLMAIAGGETAILKGARRLRALAVIQIYSILATLLISVPLYYFFGEAAIVPVIVLMALVSMLITIRFSYSFYPLRLMGAKGVLGEGMAMIRLGIAFVLAGILGSGAEMLIRSYLNVAGSLADVGFYNAGYMLIVTYAGTVFTAMETDYFPRLSAVCHQTDQQNLMVNRQIEVSLLIAAPMLAILLIGLPLFVPLLYSAKFLPIVTMAQAAIFSMYIKSVSLPIAYLTLAKGDSLAYLVLEAIYDMLVVALVVVGYENWGMLGTGWALSVSYLIDILYIYGYARWRYGYRMSKQVVQYMAIQYPIGMAAYIVTFIDNPYIYWTLGALLCFVSLAISVYVLHQKTSLWNALQLKVKSKFARHD